MTIPTHSDLMYNFEEEIFRVQKIDFSSPVPRHKHSCYELFFILDGEVLTPEYPYTLAGEYPYSETGKFSKDKSIT